MRPFRPLPTFEQGVLPAFYQRVTKAIRSAGADQVILPEGVADSNQPPVLPRLRDPQTAFNFHYYCTATQLSPLQVPVGVPSPQATACAPLERLHLGAFINYAKTLDVPGFLSEFSCNDINPDNAQVVDLVAPTFTSWTAWAYYPQDIGSDCSQQGLLRHDGDPGSARQDKLDALAVPYATAIAGTPISTSLNRASGTYRLSYRSVAVPGAHLQPTASTVVFLPARTYSHGYITHVHGARVTSRANARWLLLTATRPRSISLTVTPR